MSADAIYNVPPAQHSVEHQGHHPGIAPDQVEVVDSIDNQDNARSRATPPTHATPPARDELLYQIREKLNLKLNAYQERIDNIVKLIVDDNAHAQFIVGFTNNIVELARDMSSVATTDDYYFMKIVDMIFTVIYKCLEPSTIVLKKFDDKDMNKFIFQFTSEMTKTILRAAEHGQMVCDKSYRVDTWTLEKYNEMRTIRGIMKIVMWFILELSKDQYADAKMKPDIYQSIEWVRKYTQWWDKVPAPEQLKSALKEIEGVQTIKFNVAGYGKHTTSKTPDKLKIDQKPKSDINKAKKINKINQSKPLAQRDLDACAILIALRGDAVAP